ncbi:hypothetical protein DdX_15714 [Ditylenchus destructor]|uniref:Uncharacterized protein n=1 Tax=Ditylenchus destructor TaxID=166010 RepID=A0AAD4MS79_9BILA|nr:hypothetical protein DdX_15714 [Ditylenchus destructor]
MMQIRLSSTSALLLIILYTSRVTWTQPAHQAGDKNATLPQVNSSTTVQTLEAPTLEVFHFGVRNETEESNTTTTTTTKGPNEESVIHQLLLKMSPEAGLSQSPYQGR